MHVKNDRRGVLVLKKDYKFLKFQAVTLYRSNPKISIREVAQQLGVSRTFVQRWIIYANKHGIKSLSTKRVNKSSRLSEEQLRELIRTITDDTTKRWNAVKVRDYIHEEYGIKYSLSNIRYLIVKRNSVSLKVHFNKFVESDIKSIYKIINSKPATAYGFEKPDWTQEYVRCLIRKLFNREYSKPFISKRLNALGWRFIENRKNRPKKRRR